MRRNNRDVFGFTLIELLVVMSIIGLLASVVLAALTSAKDGARVAASTEFSSALYHAYGADAFGYWKFNEPNDGSGIGTDAADSGPNNITLLRGPTPADINCKWKRSADTPPSFGLSLDYSLCPNDSGVLGFFETDVGGKSLTLSTYTASVWVKLPSSAVQGYVFELTTKSPNSRLAFINMNGGNTSFNVGPATAGAYVSGVTINYSLPIGKWVNITYSYSGSSVRVYIDGKLLPLIDGTNYSPTQTPGSLLNNRVWLVDVANDINAGGGNHYFYGGMMDELAIYPTVYTAEQVKELYLAGLPRHTLASRK